MKCSWRLTLSLAVAAALATSPALFVSAEDIDLFTGTTSTTSAADRPNILIILDNSQNWSRADNGWPLGEKQGQSELRAIKTLLNEPAVINDEVNIGLMMFNEGQAANRNDPRSTEQDGAYVRFHIRQMTATNKAALQELIGDQSCSDGPNSLNGTPNCIFKNFDDSTMERNPTGQTHYSTAMFEAFKYFGGFTSPTNAQTGVAGSPVSRYQFGTQRYSGAVTSRYDPAAYTDTAKTFYNPPISATNSCARNYIIYIGNGYKPEDSRRWILTGVNGDATQLPFPGVSYTAQTKSKIIGNNGGVCESEGTCNNSIPLSLKQANPADSYACVNPVRSDCTGGARKWDYQATKTVYDPVSDGTNITAPTYSTSITDPLNSVTYPSGTLNIHNADEWARFLLTTDVSPVAGQQNVSTYTIDVFKDVVVSNSATAVQQQKYHTALLMNVAKAGGGRYFATTNEESITEALRRILTEIQNVNSAFAAASLPVSATNRAQNENQVFFGLFRPDAKAKPRWYGNFKRYQVTQNPTTKELFLADTNGTGAVSSSTGFFNSCAQSFWTVGSEKYWQTVAGAPQQECPTAWGSLYSDLPDGPNVEKGGAAQVVRRGNDPPTTATTPTYVVNRTMYTCADTGSCPTGTFSGMVTFDSTNVTQARVGAANATDHANLVNYTRGQDTASDVLDEQSNGTTTDTRASIHGDVVHSRPLAVNYGSGTGVVVYYGGNDGVMRAVRSNDGKELWSFIAPEHHSKLKRLWENNPLIKYPNILDASAQRKDYFFDGAMGLFQNADNSKIWIYPSMRRGGRMLYGFDVTNPNAPILKWRAGCPNLADDVGCTSGFEGIGQTWSAPSAAFVKGFSNFTDGATATPVIVVGGGYDSCEDTDSSAPACSSATGRKVFVLNAFTGAVVASFATERSVPADVMLMERDFDGNVDHAYIADTGGNLYRIDFVNAATKAALPPPAAVTGSACAATPTEWCITKIANTNSADGRKFLFPPAVLFARSGGNDIAILTLGSGDRERPLYTNYPYQTPVLNRFYAFVDLFSTDSSAAINLDTAPTSLIADITTTPLSDANSLPNIRGWRMDLTGGSANPSVTRGEQVVTSSLISGGSVFFNTHRALQPAAGVCNANLGEARGYNVDFFSGKKFSVVDEGGGLPISPVQGTVTLANGATVIFVIGASPNPNVTTLFTPARIKPVIAPIRYRSYWYRHGDK